jgi:2,4-dienoyl-CoA reductase-like NADH-dependent reductase (Old Yellow Enzyme family)
MYEKLFTPYRIGTCEISNRLVVTAMVHNYCDPTGQSTERSMAYFEEKAKGGWGLIRANAFEHHVTSRNI